MSQEIKNGHNGQNAAKGGISGNSFAKVVGNAGNGKAEPSPQQLHRTRLISEADDKIDPFCDPNKPQRISFHDVTSAAFLIKDGIERTPCPVSTSITHSSVNQ